MQQRDRDQIDRCLEEILPLINMLRLWPRLIESKVFYEADMNVPRWKLTLNDPATMRDILESIKTRGPFAFRNFVDSLRRSNHHNVAAILEGTRVVHSNNNIPSNVDNASNDDLVSPLNENNVVESLTTDDYYRNKLQVDKKPLEIKVRKATRFLDNASFTTIGRYRMRTKPRGCVLIITIITYMNEKKRNAAEHDEANLKKLFTDMGFEVTALRNLTGAEIMQAVKEFSERKDFWHVDSCFVIISAHGAQIDRSSDTELDGTDYRMSGAVKVYCSDLIDFFTAEKCRALARKPKVFIFQACRVIRKPLEPIRRTEVDGANIETPRKYSDILITHSTMPGFAAYRDIFTGSWYIQILCEVFMNHAHNTHLKDLFDMIDRRLMDIRTEENEAQTSRTDSIGFNLHCYLNPGLFEDP